MVEQTDGVVFSAEKVQLEKDMETIAANIIKFWKRYEDAFTDEEKAVLLQKIKMLEGNHKKLWTLYEKNLQHTVIRKMDDSPPYNGYYNVDDPSIKAKIGKGLSYNSGCLGYTKKEIEILKKLIS